jgi:hypothetical protein
LPKISYSSSFILYFFEITILTNVGLNKLGCKLIFFFSIPKGYVISGHCHENVPLHKSPEFPALNQFSLKYREPPLRGRVCQYDVGGLRGL